MSGDLLSSLAAPATRENAGCRRGPAARLCAGCRRQSCCGQSTGVARTAPFRHMETPGGYRMSVAMTNCGAAGWVTDRSGYRYDPVDPVTRPCPGPPCRTRSRHLPERAAAAAGYAGFIPDACLVNRYEPGARLSLHQDRNERDCRAPIVSVVAGTAGNLPVGWRDAHRSAAPHPRWRAAMSSCGAARRACNSTASIRWPTATHELTGRCRINLTFRRAL